VTVECNREAFRHIRALKGNQYQPGGNYGSRWHAGYLWPTAVEQTLCQSLQQWFTKAHGSPFLHQPLLQDVGFLGCGTTAQEILASTYQCPTDTDEYTKLFIEALRWPTLCPDIISSILNMENFCNHWQRARESTSSSFSSLHFCHSYKVAVSTPTIAHLHAHFTQLVFMSGILLSWYQSGLQMILEKSRSNTCGSLQAILLMEVAFNATMKILIGHWMVCNAIKSHAVPQDFFRSLPEHTAIQVSLNRCLVGDVS